MFVLEGGTETLRKNMIFSAARRRHAVGEQTLNVGFVLICEMRVSVKGLSISP